MDPAVLCEVMPARRAGGAVAQHTERHIEHLRRLRLLQQLGERRQAALPHKLLQARLGADDALPHLDQRVNQLRPGRLRLQVADGPLHIRPPHPAARWGQSGPPETNRVLVWAGRRLWVKERW